MITIHKPTQVPAILLDKGVPETDLLIKAFEQMPVDFSTGAKNFIFKKGIYGGRSVKRILWEAQSKKCVFCELKKEMGEGHVEHFRGKGGYKQAPGDLLGKPGYYWLAYHWDNLFFSCSTCNSSYKMNYFPLADPTKRAKSHLDDLTQEEPLFIHPSENPEDFIEFNSWNIRPVNGNNRGKTTIELIGLDRDFHQEERMTHYKVLKEIWTIATDLNQNADTKQKLLALLNEAAAADKTYSCMVKCAIRDGFKY